MQKLIIAIFLCTSLVFIASMSPMVNEAMPVDRNSPVAETLERLGDIPLPHQPKLEMKGVSAEAGEAIVLHGFSTEKNGQKTSKQSKHFVCTSCHNVVKEDPDLSVADPQARLEYADQYDLPYLQGTTLHGAVNRLRFYNGDYDKKYGDLVKPARRNLREAIQLCAIECSQGRPLKAWEIESVLSYLWTLELKMGDLILNNDDYRAINDAIKMKDNQDAMIELIQSKYLDRSPATFVIPPENRKTGYEQTKTGNPENGQLLYEKSCLHCHNEQRYSFYNLDNSKYSFEHLAKHFSRYTRYSTYQVARYGTPPMNGKRAYMPQYTEEKMSNQQMEDLRAYIEQEAKK